MFRNTLIWTGVLVALVTPVLAATMSPLLAWRDPIYIASGFAGVIAMALMLLQPVLAASRLPGLSPRRSRHTHRWIGITLVVLVLLHVGGLWITSPPDVIDALLFASPTPFSNWGVIAMWAAFGAAALVIFRRTLRLPPRVWRLSHRVLATVIVAGTVTHALLIEGAMETVTKTLVCIVIVLATLAALIKIKL